MGWGVSRNFKASVFAGLVFIKAKGSKSTKMSVYLDYQKAYKSLKNPSIIWNSLFLVHVIDTIAGLNNHGGSKGF